MACDEPLAVTERRLEVSVDHLEASGGPLGGIDELAQATDGAVEVLNGFVGSSDGRLEASELSVAGCDLSSTERNGSLGASDACIGDPEGPVRSNGHTVEGCERIVGDLDFIVGGSNVIVGSFERLVGDRERVATDLEDSIRGLDAFVWCSRVTASAFDSWKTLQIRGSFRLSVPGDATYTLDDDGRTLCVRLATEPVTEVLVGRWDFKKELLAKGTRAALESEVRRFIEEAFANVVKKKLEGVYETWEDAGTRLLLCQGVALLDRKTAQWVIARGFTQNVASDFFMAHWNGPKHYLTDPVVHILESFELDLG